MTSEASGSRFTRWKKPLTIAFFLLLIVLFTLLARRIDWSEVLQTLGDFKLRTLLIAGALTLCSFLVYASFDLIGRTYIRQPLRWKQILPVGIISYAFNLNLSAWVGGIAMRYRLYSRLGVSTSNIAKILGLSLATNWFGYMALAGVVFSSGLVTMPPGWKVSSGALQGIGALLVLVSLGYLAACQFSKKRAWSIKGIEINLPSLRMACLQLAMGALNWSLMAAVIFTLLPAKLDYPLVLGVLLISAIAGVVTHIPAGLGVLEAVFIALLQHEASRGSLLAGLIAYRAIYFILPLLIALVMYLAVEAKAKALRVKKPPRERVKLARLASAHAKIDPVTHHEATRMAKQALILIDIQNDYFPQGKWPLDGVEAAADKAAQVLNAFRQAGDAVIHVRHEFTAEDAPFFTPASEGAHLHAKVLNEGDEPVVLKHFVNAFRGTELRALLEKRSITDVVVVGSMSHMCIDAVVRAAADLGYTVTVIHDACATCDQQFNGEVIPAAQVHGAYMASLGFGYASVVSADDYLKAQAAAA